MPALIPFHEVRFPTAIAFGASGGPERRTDIVTLGSGHEERNSRWADSRRRYNAGYGVRSLDDLHAASPSSRSGAGGSTAFAGATASTANPARRRRRRPPTDQTIGAGDGATARSSWSRATGACTRRTRAR